MVECNAGFPRPCRVGKDSQETSFWEVTREWRHSVCPLGRCIHVSLLKYEENRAHWKLRGKTTLYSFKHFIICIKNIQYVLCTWATKITWLFLSTVFANFKKLLLVLLWVSMEFCHKNSYRNKLLPGFLRGVTVKD